MIKEITNIAAECIKAPRRESVWSDKEGKYACPDSLTVVRVNAHLGGPPSQRRQQTVRRPLRNLKSVFLSAAGGTLLFVLLLSMLAHLLAKNTLLFEKVIISFL